MSSDEIQSVTDGELNLLEALWQLSTATIRQVVDQLHPEGCTTGQYATVQKLLERLELKGFVARNRDTWPHELTPTIDRDVLIGRELRATAEKLCGGSVAPLLQHLLKSEQFSDEERRELRDFFEQIKKQRRSKDNG